jgi:hypothetical protein
MDKKKKCATCGEFYDISSLYCYKEYIKCKMCHNDDAKEQALKRKERKKEIKENYNIIGDPDIDITSVQYECDNCKVLKPFTELKCEYRKTICNICGSKKNYRGKSPIIYKNIKDGKQKEKTIELNKRIADKHIKMCSICFIIYKLDKFGTKDRCSKCRAEFVSKDVKVIKCPDCKLEKTPEEYGTHINRCNDCQEKFNKDSSKRKNENQKNKRIKFNNNENADTRICSRCNKIKNIDLFNSHMTCNDCREENQARDEKNKGKQNDLTASQVKEEKRKEKGLKN